MHFPSLSQNPPERGSGNRHDRSLTARLLAGFVMCLLCAVVIPESAEAAVYRCATVSGDTQFQDTPCSIDKPNVDPRRAAKSGAAGSAAGRPLPAGIHSSWFSPPPGIAYEALCDEQGCECGSVERSFDNGLQIAVGDALYLDGSWHRFDTAVSHLMTATRGGDRAGVLQYQAEIEDTACEILMSQQILMQFAEKELVQLRRDAQIAEDLGRDSESSCDGFSEAACSQYQQWLAYQTMLADARSLSVSREHAELQTLLPDDR